jgi:hypothetical protein
LPGEIEEKPRKLQSGYSQPRLKPGTFQIKARSVTTSTNLPREEKTCILHNSFFSYLMTFFHLQRLFNVK